MRLGIDASALEETRRYDPHYYVEGKEIDPLAFCHDRLGVEVLRLRLWLDPYDERGVPYGGGTNDLATFLKLAKEGIAKGYAIMLDFHYSDFWCDPGKQTCPKAWKGLDYEGVRRALGEYTRDTLLKVKEEGIDLCSVQVGNEITNGMVWPFGFVDHDGDCEEGYRRLCPLLVEGCKAVREVYPNAKTIIHLEKSFDQKVYREFFDHVTEFGLDYDVIGMSYYPYWHGTFEQFFANVDMVRARYGKPIYVVETAYAFSVAPANVRGNDWMPWVNPKQLAHDGSVLAYPLTKQGQKDFIEAFLTLCRGHGVEEVDYWEPLWLPLEGTVWANHEGMLYINQTEKPEHNEWMNNCLFDYEGNANPGLFAFCRE